MEHSDVAIISLGPAGVALARQLGGKVHVIVLDKKRQCSSGGFVKSCDGLLALDAQCSFIHDEITLPVDAVANLQIFSAKTVDIAVSLTRNYQCSYTNINRYIFGLWLKSLIPDDIQVYHDSLCWKIWRESDKWHIIFHVSSWEQQITTCYLVGVDGANSLARRHFYPQHQIRKCVTTQQWLAEKHPAPSYSCISDGDTTDCYPWSVSRDGYFIFGGAYPMKDGQAYSDTLKEKLEAFHFQLDKPVKNEKCMVLFLSRWKGFICGEDSAFLIGEAAGLISASLLEGISYVLDSAEILKSVLLRDTPNMDHAHHKATRKL